MLKYVGVSALSLAAGAGIGYLVTRKFLETRLEEKYAARAEQEVKELRALQKVYREDRNVRSTITDEAMVEQVSTIVDGLGPSRSSIDHSQLTNREEERKRYHKLGTASEARTVGRQEVVKSSRDVKSEVKGDGNMGPLGEGVAVATDEDLLDNHDLEPRIISNIAYDDDNDGYVKYSISYYDEDSVAVDDEGSVLTDIQNTIGWECTKVLETQPMVWVRNDRLKADYEVALVQGSYERDILGIDHTMTPAEKREAMSRRN